MSLIYELIGRLFVGHLRRRYGREIRMAAGAGAVPAPRGFSSRPHPAVVARASARVMAHTATTPWAKGAWGCRTPTPLERMVISAGWRRFQAGLPAWGSDSRSGREASGKRTGCRSGEPQEPSIEPAPPGTRPRRPRWHHEQV